MEEADRKQAFGALLADEMAAIDPKLKAAVAAGNLTPVIETARALADLSAIETAATGTNDQTKKIGANLGSHAHMLIKAALQSLHQRTEKSWAAASRNRSSDDRRGALGDQAYGMWGLTSVETSDLKDVIATTEKIIPVATQLGEVTESADLKGDAPEAEKIRDRAREVLDYDYNNQGRYNQQPPRQRATGSNR